MERPIQVIYAPGTFGNTIRWMLDRFSEDSNFKDVNSPWDQDGRAHGFSKDQFLKKFIRGHQTSNKPGRSDDMNIDLNADKIVVAFDPVDLVFIERCGFYRNPGYEHDNIRYEAVIHNADQSFVTETFGEGNSKSIAKELMKIQFHNINNHVWWTTMNEFLQNNTHHQLNMYAMWDEGMLTKELQLVSQRFNLNLNIESNVIKNVVDKIKSKHVVITKDRAKQALDAIMNRNKITCKNFDIVEQAFIESELEKTHDSIIFPYGTCWFDDTTQINDFLDTYPAYLKHMNPRLPWYNNLKNPFYLTGHIDKSK